MDATRVCTVHLCALEQDPDALEIGWHRKCPGSGLICPTCGPVNSWGVMINGTMIAVATEKRIVVHSRLRRAMCLMGKGFADHTSHRGHRTGLVRLRELPAGTAFRTAQTHVAGVVKSNGDLDGIRVHLDGSLRRLSPRVLVEVA